MMKNGKPSKKKQNDREQRWSPELSQNSEYYRYVNKLMPLIKGKVVTGSITGENGFLLLFGDNAWLAIYQQGSNLRFEYGEPGESMSLTMENINVSSMSTGGHPVAYSLSKGMNCPNRNVVLQAHGKPIVGLSFGVDSMKFRFPEGNELETLIALDEDGQLALRAFWEEW